MMIGHRPPKLSGSQKGSEEEEGWNSFGGVSSVQLLIMRRETEFQWKAYQKRVSREDRQDKRYYCQKQHKIWQHGCITYKLFIFL